MLLQIMEEGHLTDAKGRKVDFRNAIITVWNFGAGSFSRIIVDNVSIRDIFRRGVHLQVGNAPTGGHIISNSSFQNISALVDADAVGVFNSDAQITSNTFAAIPCAIKCDNVLAPSVPTRLVATKNRISGLIATPMVLSPAAMILNTAADGTIIGGSALDANDIDLTIGGTPQDLGILVQPAGEAVISYNNIQGSAQDVGIAALGAPALQPIQILENTLTASGSADLGDGTAAGIWLGAGFIMPGISWQGHVGGAIAGAATMWVMLALERAKRRP